MILDYLGGSMDDTGPDDRQREILLLKRKCCDHGSREEAISQGMPTPIRS